MGRRNMEMVTFVYPYYKNGEMLKKQQEYWASYPDKIRKSFEVIVVDDCSPTNKAIDNIETDVDYDLKLYRVNEDIRWNWLACRNIGAYHAKNKWLLLTDMDHAVDADVIKKLYKRLSSLDETYIYLFERRDAPDLTFYKPHNDSFFMTKELFWRTGGYDEDLSGFYGTSGDYRRRAFKTAKLSFRFTDLYLIRYPREIISDASTTDFTRKDPEQKERLRSVIKEKSDNDQPIKVLSFPYERLS